jgi:hypothetical protein
MKPFDDIIHNNDKLTRCSLPGFFAFSLVFAEWIRR